MDALHPPMPLEGWLEIVQNVCGVEVLRNFLLDTSSSSDLGILTSKAHSQHAVIGTVDVQMLKDTLFGTLFSATWLFIPAFCYQKFSAMLLTQEYGPDTWSKKMDPSFVPASRVMSRCENLVAHANLKLCRVVRDEDNGVFLAMDINEQYDMVRIMAVSVDRSKRQRQRASFQVDRAALERGDFAGMRQSVQFYMHFTENCVCQLCSVVDGNDCNCPLPKPSRPLHPLDLETTTKNFSIYTGAYSGRYTELVTCRASENIRRQNFVVGNFQGGARLGTIERLHSWAISNSLAKYFSNVTISNLPFSMELVSKAHRIIAEYLPVINTSSSSPQTSGFFNGAINSLDPIPLIGTSALLVDQGPIIDEEQTNNVTNEGAVSIMSGGDGMVPVSNEYSPGFPGSTAEVVEYNDAMIEPSAIHTPDTHPTASQSGTLPVTFRLPKTIKPMRTNGIRIPEPEIQRLPVDNSSEAKALRRKIRNRESAARSNLRRRNGLANLKKNLSQGRERLESLKLKYEEMKETNIRLRRQVEGERMQDKSSVNASRLSSR